MMMMIPSRTRPGFDQVVMWSGQLDPTVGNLDNPPASRGNNTLGPHNETGTATP
jgi:hypothetical protein